MFTWCVDCSIGLMLVALKTARRPRQELDGHRHDVAHARQSRLERWRDVDEQTRNDRTDDARADA
jgi:hypothetical protein